MVSIFDFFYIFLWFLLALEPTIIIDGTKFSFDVFRSFEERISVKDSSKGTLVSRVITRVIDLEHIYDELKTKPASIT